MGSGVSLKATTWKNVSPESAPRRLIQLWSKGWATSPEDSRTWHCQCYKCCPCSTGSEDKKEKKKRKKSKTDGVREDLKPDTQALIGQGMELQLLQRTQKIKSRSMYLLFHAEKEEGPFFQRILPNMSFTVSLVHILYFIPW